jgi:YegS/Rv2252/BmrU family lipid kinase
MRTLVLAFNLSSKNGANQKKYIQEILVQFRRTGIQVIHFETSTIEAFHAKIQENLAMGYHEFIVCGGDGSLHALVNILGINDALQTATVGLIPMGTGNDYIRNFQSKTRTKIIEDILVSKTCSVDIGCIRFRNSTYRYFINVAGIGFNGAVIKDVNRFKFLGGLSYYVALISCFFKFKPQEVIIKLDDVSYQMKTFIASFGIGKYAGNNMKLCPEAKLDDGFFDVNIIRPITKLELITNLPKLRSGTYLKSLDCKTIKATKIEIVRNAYLDAEADGEQYGREISSFENVSKGLTVFGELDAFA